MARPTWPAPSTMIRMRPQPTRDAAGVPPSQLGGAVETPGMDRHSDEELLALAPARPEAFAAFYRRHERLLLGFFMRRTGEPELAADLTAETFAAALVSVRRFDPSRGP